MCCQYPAVCWLVVACTCFQYIDRFLSCWRNDAACSDVLKAATFKLKQTHVMHSKNAQTGCGVGNTKIDNFCKSSGVVQNLHSLQFFHNFLRFPCYNVILLEGEVLSPLC